MMQLQARNEAVAKAVSDIAKGFQKTPDTMVACSLGLYPAGATEFFIDHFIQAVEKHSDVDPDDLWFCSDDDGEDHVEESPMWTNQYHVVLGSFNGQWTTGEELSEWAGKLMFEVSADVGDDANKEDVPKQ